MKLAAKLLAAALGLLGAYVVDDAGAAWLHGANAAWMRNPEARPTVKTAPVRLDPLPDGG